MDSKLSRPGTRSGTLERERPRARLRRRKPRAFEEWKALAAWNRLPAWESRAPGYQLRLAREAAGLTQAEVAARLGITQQAVARSERWSANPTVRALEAWAEALGGELELEISAGRRDS